MSFQENQSDSGDGFDGDGEAIGSVISPQHSLQHAPTQHEPHKLSTGPAGIKSDSTRNTQVTTTAGITPSVPVKPTEYIPGNENGPILIDTLSGRNELVNVSNINREVPNLFPIIGVPKGIPAGIAIPPAVPLDLPTLGGNKNQKRLQVEKFQQQSMTFRRQPATSTNQSVPLQQQFISHDRSDLPLELSDPQSIIHISSQFYHAGDYGMMIKSLEVLDRHLVLSEEIEMAREFGQGLAHFKKYQCNIAKKFFNSLLEISVKHQSAGDHALASIYLGEVELYYDNHEVAVKHFTVAVSEYQIDNVAKLFEITVMSKSAVLVKKGSCHRALSQIREAISAFKMAKQDAELHQYNSTGEMLKEAKQDEMGAVAALGNILQSVGDYEQSYECYSDSLKLAKELGDRVSEGWAHGNLGNALLGLDRNDKALDHLTIAYNMSAKYECHPLAVGRAVSNLGNAYQSMGSLRKAKEYYEIALGHAIYGSDQQGQSRACGNIGNIYMTMKEPVKAVHHYTETLRLSSDRSTKTTGYHNRGCARFEVAECIIQGKKPKELVRSSTRDSVYRTLTIKLTDEVITTHPVQETSLDYSAHSVSESEEMIEQVVATPSTVSGKSLDIVTSEEVTRLTEALPFYETAKADLIEAVEAHERGIQNVKGSHESLNLSTLLFENNSKSFYKLQETSVEIGRVHLRLSELGIMDSESQEFKQALVFAEQARARTLGELLLQKKRASCSDLLAVSTPLGLSDIFKTVEKQKMPAVFLSYCLSKLLMWVLIPINGEVKMRCNTIQLRNEDFDNGSFELYIRYNLLQFLNQNEVHIFQRCAYEQESPFTVLYDVIARRIMEAFESLGASKVTEFIVIPDSVTHLMPFSPLINKQNWEFLGDRFRIRIVPSFLTQLIMSVTGNPIVEVPGDKSDFVVVGNPNIPPFELDSVQWNLGRLPYAEKEAVSVANIVGTTAVLREQATKQSVLYRLRSGKIIHLATHGSANAGFLAFASSFPVPKSGIVNSEHILIFPKEIETLNISPALVVLSSCDSGRGQVKAEGVIGMARAFLSAGAQSVLVSLWRVPDESAHIFMQYFYQFLVNGLLSFHALQRSMQSLRCFHKYSHFVHWSGFQIIGKEITLHKSSNSQFPILKLIGEASIFPRQSVKEIGEGLLSGKTKSLSNVQLLVGTPGNEPEECARDVIKTYYKYYPCGMYWYDVSDELALETCAKVVTETTFTGEVHEEQKENIDNLPDINAPTLQASLIKECGDSRAGFELAKHQLKFLNGLLLEVSQILKNTNGSRSHCKLHSTIHTFISDLIRNDHCSLLAQHLLYYISRLGSILLPQFCFDKLDNVVTTAVTTEEGHSDLDAQIANKCEKSVTEKLKYPAANLCGMTMDFDICDRCAFDRLTTVKESSCGHIICTDCLKDIIDPFITGVCSKCQDTSQNLTHHVEYECPRREVKCQYCHLVGEQQFIEGEHDKFCPKFPVICPKKSSNNNTISQLQTENKINKVETFEQMIIDPEGTWRKLINSKVGKSSDQTVPVLVKMMEYTNKKRNNINWYSDSFYTHYKGYKLRLCVHFKNNTHLSACLFLVEGPYDSQLKEHCEVRLLNQVSNSEHHLGVGKYIDIGHNRITTQERGMPMWYSTQFIANEVLYKTTATCQYLKDDSIFFHVN